jgi:hypothetical protein
LEVEIKVLHNQAFLQFAYLLQSNQKGYYIFIPRAKGVKSYCERMHNRINTGVEKYMQFSPGEPVD